MNLKSVVLALLLAATVAAACAYPKATPAPSTEFPTLPHTGGPPQPTIMVPPPIY